MNLRKSHVRTKLLFSESKKFTESMYAEHETEDEIVIDLISVLNEKIINYVLQIGNC